MLITVQRSVQYSVIALSLVLSKTFKRTHIVLWMVQPFKLTLKPTTEDNS